MSRRDCSKSAVCSDNSLPAAARARSISPILTSRSRIFAGMLSSQRASCASGCSPLTLQATSFYICLSKASDSLLQGKAGNRRTCYKWSLTSQLNFDVLRFLLSWSRYVLLKTRIIITSFSSSIQSDNVKQRLPPPWHWQTLSLKTCTFLILLSNKILIFRRKIKAYKSSCILPQNYS